MQTVTGVGPYSGDEERVRERCLAASGGSWEGSNIKTRPMVSRKTKSGGGKDVDKMLKDFSRRVHKNGKLEEYEKRQHFTQPAEERRQKRMEQEYRAKKQENRRQ